MLRICYFLIFCNKYPATTICLKKFFWHLFIYRVVHLLLSSKNSHTMRGIVLEEDFEKINTEQCGNNLYGKI